MVKIIGCDYKLLESEILNWLVLFGEVLSEITEELFEDATDPECSNLPPIGNGNYLVKMRLTKDLPNWMPIYGKRICLDYKGNKKQCNWCFGPHMRKYCKNERMSLDEYATRFRLQHPKIPEQYYGKLAKLENLDRQMKAAAAAAAAVAASSNTPVASDVVTSGKPSQQVPKIYLCRESIPGANWVKVAPAAVSPAQDKPVAVNKAAELVDPKLHQASNGVVSPTSSMAQSTRIATGIAVSSMLNAIRATFKQPEKEVLPRQSPGQTEGPVKAVTAGRNSSATRGRGLSRSKTN